MGETNTTLKQLDKQYYRDKMAEYRVEWKSMGVSATSVLLPERFKPYFTALALLLTAEDAIAAVEERTPEALDVFSNRVPRMPHSRASLHTKVLLYKDSEDPKRQKLFAQATNILELFDLMKMAKEHAGTSQEEFHSEATLYWLSREYALSLYVRGAVEMFELRETRDDLPEKIEI